MPTETGLPAAASASGRDAAPRAFRHRGSSFSDKLDAFTQDRLRLSATMVAVIAALALTATGFQYARLAGSEWAANMAGTFEARATFGVTLVAVGVRFFLGRRRLSRAALAAVDTGLLFVVFGALTGILVANWESGEALIVAFLVIAIFARAVFVPSRALRTFLLSAAAPIAVLSVELSQDEMWAAYGVAYKDPAYLIIWNQVVLWVSVGVAACASHINFALRLAAYEAGKVGQYELEEKIGEGAMGEVWRARHGLLRRPTAVKLIRAELVDDRTRKRFEHEVRQTCRLSHPNVIAIYDFGHGEDGVFFYAMELLEGADLRRVVRETGPMPPARAIHVLVQACEALAEAHAASLVHRDVKPANIMVTRRGLSYDVVKVMDFGLVKDTGGGDVTLTGAGEICGTPETIAPETIRGRPVGPAADLYALGVVGCWLLTGRDVFDAATPLEFVAAHLHQQPTPPSERLPDVPADLEAVLMQCLRKDPTERPASATALRDALLACADAGRWTQREAATWWESRAESPQSDTFVEPPATQA